MSDHQKGGGFPFVGILGVMALFPLATWFLLSTPHTTPHSAAPVAAPSPAVTVPVEAGSTPVQKEEETGPVASEPETARTPQ